MQNFFDGVQERYVKLLLCQAARSEQLAGKKTSIPATKVEWFSCNMLGAALEFLIVILLAFAVFCLHQFAGGAPNITLSFDSFSYLVTAGSAAHALTPSFLSAIASYILHGFQEPDRIALLQNFSPPQELIKTGPIVPVVLSIAYGLAGKTIDTPHWQVGSVSMIACLSVATAFVWLLSRQMFGIGAARISAVMALMYPPFSINGGRILRRCRLLPSSASLPGFLSSSFAAAENLITRRLSVDWIIPPALKAAINLRQRFCPKQAAS